jgi:hypothetical protein
MNKNKIAFVVVLILTFLALWLHFNKKSSTLKQELRDFAVEDTASITKIFLADKNGNQVLLEKLTPGHWRANDKFDARIDAIDNLLLTIKQVDVKEPVGKKAMENVIRQMATNSIKVEIYQGSDKPSKVYYVGHATQDNMGTFMLMENSSVPFIMHIKGFFGYLNTRYFAEAEKWRTSELFSYKLEQLRKVEVSYPSNKDKCYTIDEINTGNPILKVNNQVINQAQKDFLLEYLSLYQRVNFEEFANEVKKSVRDSITANGPLFTITATEITGKTNTIKAYRKPSKAGNTDMNGEAVNYDLDRMNAYINNDKDGLGLGLG